MAAASTAAAVFQVAITGEVPASAAIAVGIVTGVAGTEVRHRREGPDLEDLDLDDLGSEDPGSDDLDLDDLVSEDLDLEDLDLDDSGTPVASPPPVIERRLLTGGGIHLEETAVGLAGGDWLWPWLWVSGRLR